MDAKFIYDESIYRQNDAERVLPKVFNIFQPNSVIDIGCGTGTWLSVAKNLGAKQVLGFDSSEYIEDFWQISADEYRVVDLSLPIAIPFKADICFCLEVAEHIHQDCAFTIVQNLINASDVILFSAAIPGQGGQNHINEQWPSYWEKIFKTFGYNGYDIIRPMIWEDNSVYFWYRQNILLFVKEEVKLNEFNPHQNIMSIVHPALFRSVKRQNIELQKAYRKIVWNPGFGVGIRIFLKSILGLFKKKNLGL